MKKFTIIALIMMISPAAAFAQSASQADASASSSTASTSNNGANTVNTQTPVDVNINIDQSTTDNTDRALPTVNIVDSTSDNTSRVTSDNTSRSSAVLQTEVKYSGEYTIKNVPNVTAPGLTTTLTETCMGSTSAGGAMVGFGFSFGTTWRDSACVRRLDARQIQSLGYPLGAKEMMCDSASVRAALKRAGRPCYNDLADAEKRPEDRKAQPRVAAAAPAKTVKVSAANDDDWAEDRQDR